jgi:hypothetical protein
MPRPFNGGVFYLKFVLPQNFIFCIIRVILPSKDEHVSFMVKNPKKNGAVPNAAGVSSLLLAAAATLPDCFCFRKFFFKKVYLCLR